ncbi:MAG: hypothetical protein K9M94_09775 [Spirochaetia bacterium]|nr:hypothetical protein [Spirochaetia bacterium]
MKVFLKLAATMGFLITFFTACDTFVLLPAFNHNPDDQNQSFGPLRAGIVDDGTIRVIWDWYDLERVVRGVKPVYDEIIIKHNRGNYPDSRLGGKSFKIKDWDPATKPLWAATFSDLKNDREHYFALYAHEKEGRWVGPMYTSRYMEGFEYEIRPGIVPNSSESFSADISAGTAANLAYPENISNNNVLVYYYDELWEDEKVVSAQIIIDINAAPTTDDALFIYPIRAHVTNDSGTLSEGLSLSSLSVDRSIRAEVSLLATDTYPLTKSVDITKVFAKAQYHRHHGLLIQVAGTTNSVPVGTDPTINAEIARNW